MQINTKTTDTAPMRFTFLAEALNGSGGFAPRVTYLTDASGMSKPSVVGSACYLVPYPRESALKFAGRVAIAVYENHLRSATERFTGYITRRKPQRDGLDNPLLKTMAEDADWAGNNIDVFWQGFMIEAKARGSMLLLVELPSQQSNSQSDALQRRLVPYLTAIAPERLGSYELNEQKRFKWVRISATHTVDGQSVAVERYWDESEWRVYHGDVVIESGEHPFGECPVLAFTEAGCYPHIGGFAQIADLSRRIYNARSELDEILRSQTFSLLTYQRTIEERATFNAADISATIGTHNMLVHEGQSPGFIAPPDGPAKVYQEVIDGLQEAIGRIGYSVDQGTNAQESGLALTIRFQALNGALSTFAQRMQDLEARMWALVGNYMGLQTPVVAQWATDYSLADIERELTILAAMQATGFPETALIAQRKRIAGEAFDAMDDAALQDVLDSIDEGGQEIEPAGDLEVLEDVTPLPVAAVTPVTPAALPAPPVDMAPVMAALAALSAKVEAMESPAQLPAIAAPPIIFNTAQGARVIDLVRDASGNLTGANVREA